MAELRVPKLAAVLGLVLSFVTGTFLGSGALWQWKKHELDVVIQTTGLRQQEIDLQAKIIDLSNEYIKAGDQYSTKPSYELSIRMSQLQSQLDVLIDNFKALENNLAHLEGREPRNIKIAFIPPTAPTGLSVRPQ